MQANEAKPAYVVFEQRTVEDRDKTVAEGKFVGKVVNYALITPQGSKDRIERVADEWLESLKDHVASDRMPRAWLDAYVSIYKDWKEGREIPLDGTPILGWQAISTKQQDLIISANIRTVEDLANANDTAIYAIGMGGRALVEKAKAWLETANDTGKVAEQLQALRTKNEALESQNKNLQAKITELEAALSQAKAAGK